MTRSETLLKEELVVFLRNSDILSIAQRGVATATQTFTGTGASQVLTLSNNTVRNIRSVNDGTARRAYFDYTPSYGTTTTITGTFTLAGANNITVVYDYSTYSATTKFEGVWGDFPEVTHLVDSVPRIGFDIMGTTTQPIGIGTLNWLSDCMVSIKVYDKNLKNVDTFLSTIRSKVKANQKLFYSFPLVYITNTGPTLTLSYLNSKVFQKNVDLILKFGFEA